MPYRCPICHDIDDCHCDSEAIRQAEEKKVYSEKLRKAEIKIKTLEEKLKDMELKYLRLKTKREK